MRVARLTADEGQRTVIWDRVQGVHYEAEGRSRWLVLTYQNGATVRLQPHQARDVYLDTCKGHERGCESPCFFKWECDSAPTGCAECRLCECVEGVLDSPLRPPPIPPRRGRVFDARNVAIALLLLLVLLLVAALDAAPRPAEIVRTKETRR